MGLWKRILTSAQEGNKQAQKIVEECKRQREELNKTHLSKELVSKIELEIDEGAKDISKELMEEVSDELREKFEDADELNEAYADFQEWMNKRMEEVMVSSQADQVERISAEKEMTND